jgi:hypothetical protein
LLINKAAKQLCGRCISPWTIRARHKSPEERAMPMLESGSGSEKQLQAAHAGITLSPIRKRYHRECERTRNEGKRVPRATAHRYCAASRYNRHFFGSCRN